MSWNFERFHEILNQTDSKNSCCLFWQTKSFISKNIYISQAIRPGELFSQATDGPCMAQFLSEDFAWNIYIFCSVQLPIHVGTDLILVLIFKHFILHIFKILYSHFRILRKLDNSRSKGVEDYCEKQSVLIFHLIIGKNGWSNFVALFIKWVVSNLKCKGSISRVSLKTFHFLHFTPCIDQWNITFR